MHEGAEGEYVSCFDWQYLPRVLKHCSSLPMGSPGGALKQNQYFTRLVCLVNNDNWLKVKIVWGSFLSLGVNWADGPLKWRQCSLWNKMKDNGSLYQDLFNTKCLENLLKHVSHTPRLEILFVRPQRRVLISFPYIVRFPPCRSILVACSIAFRRYILFLCYKQPVSKYKGKSTNVVKTDEAPMWCP